MLVSMDAVRGRMEWLAALREEGEGGPDIWDEAHTEYCSSRKVSGLTQTAVFALATPKSPIDRGGRWQLQFYLYCNFVFTFL
jgi:hypothetical protein